MNSIVNSVFGADKCANITLGCFYTKWLTFSKHDEKGSLSQLFGLSNQITSGYCRKKLLRGETLEFTSFQVPSHEGLFPKSYFHLKSAKVYFREISQDKESNVYVMKYVYSSSLTTTLSNHVTTSIYIWKIPRSHLKSGGTEKFDKKPYSQKLIPSKSAILADLWKLILKLTLFIPPIRYASAIEKY